MVERSSDNAQLGFTPTEITDGTLTAWVGTGNNGTIVNWYDQSGNGIDLTPTTTPPLIVDSGVLNNDGTPYLQSDGNENVILRNTLFSTASTNASLFTINNAPRNNQSGILINGDLGSKFLGVMTINNAAIPQGNSGSPTYYKDGTLIPSATRDDLYDEYILNVDVLVTVLNIDLTLWTTLSIFAYAPTSSLTQATKIREFILFDTDQTANKSAIESNINAYYTIY